MQLVLLPSVLHLKYEHTLQRMGITASRSRLGRALRYRNALSTSLLLYSDMITSKGPCSCARCASHTRACCAVLFSTA